MNIDIFSDFIKNASVGMAAGRSIVDDQGQIVDFEMVLHNPYGIEIGAQYSLVGQRLLKALPNHRDPIEGGSMSLFDQYVRSAGGEMLSCKFRYPGLGIYKINSFPLPDGFGCVYTDITDDVNTLEKAIVEFEHATTHDQLTGIYNRIYLDETFNRIISRPGKGMAFVMVDVDNFSYYNNEYGHGVGDRILQAIAHRIQSTVRSSDVVARWAGDEFSILLIDIPKAQAVRVLYEVRDAVSGNALYSDLFGSVTIGFNWTDKQNVDPEEFANGADLALIQQKRKKKGEIAQFGVDSQLLELPYQKERELRQAIADKDLILHYQPIINLATGGVEACEALVRWQRGDSLVYPDEFLPLASETRQMLSLCQVVISKAIAQAKLWGLRIDINLSAEVLEQQQFLINALTQMKSEGIEPGLVGMEITETLPLALETDIAALINRLKLQGHALNVDDFGTGHNGLKATLGLISGGGIGGLKLDKFFADNLTDPLYCQVIEAIADICQKAFPQLSTTAEGIEHQWQADQLREMGVDYGQGWLWAKAMPPAEFEIWMRNR